MAARLTTYVVVAIVAATLIAGLIVGAQRDDSEGPVDLIVFNGKVYTADGPGPKAQAVAIRGNQVLRVGNNRDIERLRRPQTVMVDARGAAVLPGFNDSDVQFLAGALALDSVDLLGASTVDEVQARVRGWIEANPSKPWVVGRGWSRDALSKDARPRQILDAAAPDRPAYITSANGETAWVNSAALRLAGITRRTKDSGPGNIEKDSRTGEPTGVLRGEAMELAARLVPRATATDRSQALHNAIGEAHRNGITSVQDANVAPADFASYEEALKAGGLNLRIYSSVPVDAGALTGGFGTLEAMSAKYPDDPLFKVGGAHVTLDAGGTTIEPDDLNRLVRLLDAGNWQVTIDASGDRAASMALDAYEYAARSNPRPERGRRHRIGRLALVDPDDLPRFGPLGVVAVLRPSETTVIPEQGDAPHDVAGKRTARAWPGAEIVRADAHLALATGWPAAPLSPLAAIGSALGGSDASTEGTSRKADATISLEQAIGAFTRVPAFASFDEQRKGSLEPGMLADLVVLSSNIFAASPAEISSTTVAVTIFDGKIVYRRSASPTD